MKSQNHIAAEHFPMTEAIRARAIEQVERVEEVAPEGAHVQLFLNHDADRSFSALFKVHLSGRDVVASEAGPDLYAAITKAGNLIRKRLFVETKQKRQSARRRRRASHETANYVA